MTGIEETSPSPLSLSRSFWKTPVFVCEQMKVKKLNTVSSYWNYKNSFDLEDPLERSQGPS